MRKERGTRKTKRENEKRERATRKAPAILPRLFTKMTRNVNFAPLDSKRKVNGNLSPLDR